MFIYKVPERPHGTANTYETSYRSIQRNLCHVLWPHCPRPLSLKQIVLEMIFVSQALGPSICLILLTGHFYGRYNKFAETRVGSVA